MVKFFTNNAPTQLLAHEVPARIHVWSWSSSCAIDFWSHIPRLIFIVLVWSWSWKKMQGDLSARPKPILIIPTRDAFQHDLSHMFPSTPWKITSESIWVEPISLNLLITYFCPTWSIRSILFSPTLSVLHAHWLRSYNYCALRFSASSQVEEHSTDYILLVAFVASSRGVI